MGWLVVASICGLVVGNLLLRSGMLVYQFVPFSLRSFALNWQVWLGAVLALTGLMLWVISAVHGYTDWSYVALGASFLVTVLCSWWFLGETLTLEKAVGTVIMIIGMVLLMHNSGF